MRFRVEVFHLCLITITFEKAISAAQRVKKKHTYKRIKMKNKSNKQKSYLTLSWVDLCID